MLPIRTINEIFRSIPSTKLASLVKGRWLDGKAQALILLLSVCDTPTFFIYQTFLPSRRRDCFTPTNLSKTALSHPLFVGRASACACTASYPHYPLLSTTSLPPLEKGEVLSPEIIRATTGGIVTPPTFFKTALSLALHHHACLMNAPLALRPCKALGRSTSGIHARPLSKVRCCRPKEFGRLPEGLLRRTSPSPQSLQKNDNPSPLANPSKTALSLSLFVGERACPSRCIEPLHPHNLLKAHPSPRPAPSRLPPLSKGGELTARHKLSLCCVLLAIRPPF